MTDYDPEDDRYEPGPEPAIGDVEASPGTDLVSRPTPGTPTANNAPVAPFGSGQTNGGIVFPLGGIDEFDPAGDMRALAESVDHRINSLGTVGWTPNSLVRRDANGRAGINTPAAATDIANRDYVDNRHTVAINTTNALAETLSTWLRPVLYQTGPAQTIDATAGQFMRAVEISTAATAGLYFIIARTQFRAVGTSRIHHGLSARTGAAITDQNTANATTITPTHFWEVTDHGQRQNTMFGLLGHTGGTLSITAWARGEGNASHLDAGSSHLIAIRLGA